MKRRDLFKAFWALPALPFVANSALASEPPLSEFSLWLHKRLLKFDADMAKLSMNPFAGRAVGGPVSAHTPYVLGDRGPELFMPSVPGLEVNVQPSPYFDVHVENIASAGDKPKRET